MVTIAAPNPAGAKEISRYWKRSMTNDPATNYYLAKVTLPLGNPDADLLRAVLVSLVAKKWCSGVRLDKAASNRFMKDNGYYAIKGKRRFEAEFLAKNNLIFITEVDIAHLCAGLDFLFGPTGKLSPGLLKFKNTKLRYTADYHGGYARLPELPKPKS
jgi:hypothetical protein